MLRVLLIILAVVSISLAFALNLPILYLVAVLLLVAAGVVLTVQMRRRHRDVPEKFEPVAPPEDDLNSLGILEIKPKARGASSTKAAEADENETATAAGESSDEPVKAEPVAREQPEPTPVLSKVRKRPPKVRIMVAEAATPVYGDVLVPAFKSLRASIDAYTVCLLRQQESPLRYYVEAMVSQNSYAREGGSFSAKEPLMSGHRSLVPVVYPRVGPNGFPKDKLGYYHEPISVRQVAMVPVVPKKAEGPYVLLVDTTNDGGLEAASVRVLLEQYARLTQVLLDSAAEGSLAPSGESEPRPRRDIIAEEMERARTMSHPLSLALVFLNRGEELSASEDEALLDDTESAFETRLREVVMDARVERFGELTFGVFYHGAPDSIARWAAGVQASFEKENGLLEGGVSVGVALMTNRHETPDDLRSDATAALQESFETGECTIVG